jgi:excisionase family DNA binding protein
MPRYSVAFSANESQPASVRADGETDAQVPVSAQVTGRCAPRIGSDPTDSRAMIRRPQEQRTYLPDPIDQIGALFSYLKRRDALTRNAPIHLAGEGQRLELPEPLQRLLLQVLESMMAGDAVTVVTHRQPMTIQQTADLLGIRRATVDKLIQRGDLAAHTGSNGRRVITFDDLLEYRNRRRDAEHRLLVAKERLQRIGAEISADRRATRSGQLR